MEDRLRLIKTTAKKAGRLISTLVPSEGVVEKEGRSNLVTAADVATEKLIIESIKSQFPHDSILAEETSNIKENILDIDHLWVIDPIDGTNNFRFERKYSAVSIAYVEKGRQLLGVAYDPYHDELFSAENGKGAYLNGIKIHVGNSNDLTNSFIATDNGSYSEGTRQNLETVLKLNPTPWTLMKGSTVLAMCDIAAGRLDLYFHRNFKPWDSAAATLIVREAGGIVKDLEGDEFDITKDQVVVGNKNLVNEFLKQING